MDTVKRQRKVLYYAGVNYLLPISSRGYYVSDARGTTVCETNDIRVAAELAKMLNELANKD